MNRRVFAQKSIALIAFASTYNYIKSSDLLVKQPNKSLDIFFNQIKKKSKEYFYKQITDFEWKKAIDYEYTKYFLKNNTLNLIDYIDFQKLKRNINFGSKGRGKIALSTPLTFEKGNFKIKTKIIGIQKGYAIPPHVHQNMSSVSLILSGEMLISHYNRLKTNQDFILVEKSSEAYQKQGEWTTMCPIKNNLHWFQSYKEDSYMLNVNVEGLNNKIAKPGIRVDIEQPNYLKNVYKATIISDEEAQIKYGKL